MNAITELPVVFSTIKGTAMNKARARVWIEPKIEDLIPFGFTRDMRMDVELLDDGIVIHFNPEGKRKPTVRAGAPKVIFDICLPAAQRDAMFKGSARLTVWASHNKLMVTI